MPVNLFVISKLKHFGLPLVKPIRFWVAACQTDKFLGCRLSNRLVSGLPLVKPISFWVAGCQTDKFLGCQLSNQNDFVLTTGKPK
jgi:hypothetical protein